MCPGSVIALHLSFPLYGMGTYLPTSWGCEARSVCRALLRPFSERRHDLLTMAADLRRSASLPGQVKVLTLSRAAFWTPTSSSRQRLSHLSPERAEQMGQRERGCTELTRVHLDVHLAKPRGQPGFGELGVTVALCWMAVKKGGRQLPAQLCVTCLGGHLRVNGEEGAQGSPVKLFPN